MGVSISAMAIFPLFASILAIGLAMIYPKTNYEMII